MQETATHTCHDDAGSSFTRLSRQLRVISAGMVLAAKLAMLAVVAMIWLNRADYRGNTRFAFTLSFAAATVAMVQCLACLRQRRWRLVLSGVIAVGCAAATGLQVMWLRTRWGEHMPFPEVMVLYATAALIGGAIGHLIFVISHAAVAAVAAEKGSFTRLAPTLGLSVHGEGYRASVEACLETAEGAFMRGLASARMLAVCAMAILLPLLAWAWCSEQILPGNKAANPFRVDTILWIVFGGCLGAGMGIVIMPARRGQLTLALPSSVAALISIGVVTAYALHHSLPDPAKLVTLIAVIIGTALAAGLAGLMARSIAGFITQRCLPAPVAVHLTRQSATNPSAVATAASALCCEICGYHLEGLPSTRCETCGIEQLRCPECGHQQPAGTMHARGLLNLYKAHTVLRVLSWLAALPVTGLLLLPWFFAGMEVSGLGVFSGRADYYEFLTLVLMVSLILITPLRLLLMHWRPLIIVSLSLPLVPLGAMTLGEMFSRAGSISADTLLFFPGWIAVSCLAPGLWIIWLWFIYGREYGDVYQWHSSRAFRHRSAEQIAAQAGITGRELPLTCACGANLAQQPVAPCAACGTLSAHCAACETRRPVSLARIGFETLIHRARQMLLATIAGFAAIVTFIAGVSMMGSSSQWQYFEMHWSQLIGYSLFPILAGGLARLLMIRRPPVAATLIAPLLVAGVYLAAGVLSFRPASISMSGMWLTAWTLNTIAALVGSVIVIPLLMLAAHVLLPRAQAKALLAWLRGVKTLDQAADLRYANGA